MSYLGREGLAHSTIKGIIWLQSRIRQINYGFPSPFDTPMPKLDQIIRGIKITRAKQGCTPKRKLLVTPVILRQIRSVWTGIGTETMLWAAATTCFFGFMRAGEVTCEEFDPSLHLAFEDVEADSRTHPTYVQLTLKASTTDPFRKGVHVVVGSTGNSLCLASAIFGYLKMKRNNPGPLLKWQDGTPLACSAFVARFRQALSVAGYIESEVQQYPGHSFRAGAASIAAALGVEDSLIKTLGRWESSAYLLYLRLPRENLQSMSRVLSQFK